MSEADAVSQPASDDDIRNDVATANVGVSDTAGGMIDACDGNVPSDHLSHAEMTDSQLPGDGYLLFTHSMLGDGGGNMDFALHQLTTATDLFDVPVIDFDGHWSG